MAITSARLIYFLRKTIDLLESETHYEWGHSGACNCGHLAQAMTGYSKAEIHRWSMEKDGDWTVKADEYCEASGFAIDSVISIMLSQGLQLEDIHHIEYLNNSQILENLPSDQKYLQRNDRDHVILYFQTWIQVLEESYQNNRDWNAKASSGPESVRVYDSIPEEELID